MNMIEALTRIKQTCEQLDQERRSRSHYRPYGEVPVWARPVRWKGSGAAIAYTIESRHRPSGYVQVPSARGGFPAIMPTFEELTGPWEIVCPDVVNSERRY